MTSWMPTSLLTNAVNTALAQAKASGDFDGADGVTPHIGDNGNWYIGSTDTGKPSRGAAGAPGAPGTPGKDGSDGHTPVKGTDYWTASDKAEVLLKQRAEALQHQVRLGDFFTLTEHRMFVIWVAGLD